MTRPTREVARIVRPAPVEVPKLRVVPDEPTSGVPGFEECPAHGWVASPHVHEAPAVAELAPELEPSSPITFGPDGWPTRGLCIDCGVETTTERPRCWRCHHAEATAWGRANGYYRETVHDIQGFGIAKVRPHRIPSWNERPFVDAPAWPGLHSCRCEGGEPHHHNHTLPNKAAVLKQLRKMGATVDADDGTRVYRGPGFEYRFRA